MRGVIIAIIVIVILAALGYFFFVINQTKTEEQAATTQKETQSEETKKPESENKVTYTDSGFSPQSLTIKSGESVTWVNNSSSTVQVGSDNHPTHTINQELTGNSFVLELAPGESKSVQLTKTGGWGYHNHLGPGVTGTITVE